MLLKEPFPILSKTRFYLLAYTLYFSDQNGNKMFRIAVFRDLCSAFGAPIQPHLEKQTILELLQEGRRSKGGKTKNVATWATKELRKLKV